MVSCPYCGHEGVEARTYPEDSICGHCGAVFYGSEKPANLLKCPRCLKQWIYSGKKSFPSYTSCPDCKSSVRCPKSPIAAQ